MCQQIAERTNVELRIAAQLLLNAVSDELEPNDSRSDLLHAAAGHHPRTRPGCH